MLDAAAVEWLVSRLLVAKTERVVHSGRLRWASQERQETE